MDGDRFKNINDEAIKEIKSRLGLTNKKIIAYIGSLNLSNHPVDLLINAFKYITEKMDYVKLLIVGGGRDLDKLQDLTNNLGIEDRVVFTGRISPGSSQIIMRSLILQWIQFLIQQLQKAAAH